MLDQTLTPEMYSTNKTIPSIQWFSAFGSRQGGSNTDASQAVGSIHNPFLKCERW